MSVTNDRRGWARAVLVLGGCLGALMVPLVGAVGLVAWAVTSFDGCDVDIDVGPSELGVVRRADASIGARLPTCANKQFTVVRLVAADGTTVWRAEAPQMTTVDRFTVGRAPRGFRDTVPLAPRALDASGTYDLQLFVVRPAESAATTAPPPGASSTGVELAFGAVSRFRPADLRTDGLWVGDRVVAPARFDRVACPSDDQGG